LPPPARLTPGERLIDHADDRAAQVVAVGGLARIGTGFGAKGSINSISGAAIVACRSRLAAGSGGDDESELVFH
jgi:hypothetical protein